MTLPVDRDELAACVSCGLCLPHCPTYRVTGEEAASPRGRIALMRRVDAGDARADSVFAGFMDACVQCRGCETACPSAVPFGRLMAGTREALAAEPALHYQPWTRRIGYRVLGHHRVLLAASSALAAAQRLRLVPRRFGLPRLPLRQPPLAGADTGSPDAWLFTGCVMDAWQRPVHAAVLRLASAAGVAMAVPAAGTGADCCGALHEHAGLRAESRRLAARAMAAFPGTAPVVVDSAGCGAALKEYGHLLGTPEAAAFSARVLDVHEWLGARLDALPAAGTKVRGVVAVQDPCHLRHVQRTHGAVRDVLRPYVETLVDLDDDGLCCGAGGAYSVSHPGLAGLIRDRKVDAIRRSGATVVASANPGCIMHLAAAGLDVRHPVELIDEAVR